MTDIPGTRTQAERKVPAFSLERCKRCGICTHFCPTSAIRPDADGVPRLVDPEACTACRLCEQLCPDFAVEMVLSSAAPSGDAQETQSGDTHSEPVPEVCHVYDPCEG